MMKESSWVKGAILVTITLLILGTTAFWMLYKREIRDSNDRLFNPRPDRSAVDVGDTASPVPPGSSGSKAPSDLLRGDTGQDTLLRMLDSAVEIDSRMTTKEMLDRITPGTEDGTLNYVAQQMALRDEPTQTRDLLLARFQNESSPDVRLSLSKIGYSLNWGELEPFFLEGMGDADERVRSKSVQGLSRFGIVSDPDEILAFLSRETSPRMKGRLYLLLQGTSIYTPQAIDLARRDLEEGKAEVLRFLCDWIVADKVAVESLRDAVVSLRAEKYDPLTAAEIWAAKTAFGDNGARNELNAS